MHLFLLLSLAIAAVAQTVSKDAPNLLLPNPPGNGIATVWTFDNNTYLENLAVRANGEILATSTNRAAVYTVHPFLHNAYLVHEFEPTDNPMGILEIANDVFAVVTANISLSGPSAWPGSTKIWRFDMVSYTLAQSPFVTFIGCLPDVGFPNGLLDSEAENERILLADSTKGVVWRVSLVTGAYNIAIQDVALQPPPGSYPLGVNGLKLANLEMFFTNSATGVVGSIPIALNDSATGPAKVFAHLPAPDDFASSAGNLPLYVVGANTLWRVDAESSQVLAGGVNDTTLLGATAIAPGRVNADRGVYYITTGVDGGSGKILAVNSVVFTHN